MPGIDRLPSLRRRLLTIALTVTALSAAAYFAAPLLSKWLPDRYVSHFAFRVEGFEVPTAVDEVTRTSTDVHAGPADDGANVVAVQCEGSAPLQARERCTSAWRRYLDVRSREAATAVTPEDDAARELASVDSVLAAARESLATVQRMVRISPSPAEEEAARSAAIQRNALQAQVATIGELIAYIERGRAGAGVYADLSRYPAELRDGEVAALVDQLLELEEHRSDLSTTRSEVNPDVQAVDWEIERAQDGLRRILVARQSSLRSRIAALGRANAADLESTPSSSPEATRLGQEIERLEGRRRELAEGMDHISQEQPEESLPSVTLVSSPTLPSTPSSPSRALIVLGGAFLGLVIGVALSLRQPHSAPPEIEPALATVLFVPPVLGSLPGLPNPRPAFRVRSLDTGETLASSGGPVSSEIAALQQELVRLIAALRAAGHEMEERPIQVLAVTSGASGQGRTFLACNLALASAAGGARTLLVDVDTGTDGLSSFLRLPASEAGLFQVLAGHATLEEVVVGLVVAGYGRLDVLGQGNGLGDSDTVLEGPGLGTTIRKAAASYDFIVIDAPPATTVTDAAWIAGAADGVLLASGSTSLHRIDDLGTADRLVRAGARVLGAVLRDPPVM